MNGFQRTVKYVAMALGLCLALSIILAIAGGVSALFGVGGWWQEGEMGTVNFSQEYAGVLNIDIDNDMGALTIRQGDVFRVEAYDARNSFTCRQQGDTLKIESGGGWNPFRWGAGGTQIVVTLPQGYEAQRVEIENGAGRVEIKGLKAGLLTIENGAGAFYGQDMSAQRTNIDAGVGEVSIQQAEFHDLDLETGVGATTITGSVTGRSRVECGVGETTLNISGNVADYSITADMGIGAISLNGQKISGSAGTPGAPNALHVSGGIGAVNINIQ